VNSSVTVFSDFLKSAKDVEGLDQYGAKPVSNSSNLEQLTSNGLN